MVGLAGSAGGVEVSVKEVPSAFPGAIPSSGTNHGLGQRSGRCANRVPYHKIYTTDLCVTSKYC